MENKLNFLTSSTSSLTTASIAGNLTLALLFAMLIYFVYKKTYKGVLYQQSFNVTLVMVCIITAMIIMVIGSNLALSLGMVGALSIVRYRTAIKDPRDVAFLFWAIAAGMSTGTGSYKVTLVASIFICVVLLVFDRVRTMQAVSLLTIRGKDVDLDWISQCLSEHCTHSRLKLQKVNTGVDEMIYEIRLKKEHSDEMSKAFKSQDWLEDMSIIVNEDKILG